MKKKNVKAKTKKQKAKKNSEVELFPAQEIMPEPNVEGLEAIEGVEKKDIFQLESLLHLLMIRLNHIEGLEFNIEPIFLYHKVHKAMETCESNDFERVKQINSEKSELEKKYPYVKEFYFVSVQFMKLITELTIYHDMLERDCFDYKIELKKHKSKILDYYSKEEFEQNDFNFTTLYLPSRVNPKKIEFSVHLIEKSLILQNKFLHLIFTVYEYYPAPKSKKEIDEYYDFLFNKGKPVVEKEKEFFDNEDKKLASESSRSKPIESGKESENNPELQSDIVNSKLITPQGTLESKRSILDCLYGLCFKKKEDEFDLARLKKCANPLLSLDFNERGNKTAQILKTMVLEFVRMYLKVEEVIYKEISES